MPNLLNDLLHFFEALKLRNEILFYFGWVNLLFAGGLLVTSLLMNIEYQGVHALYKPMKFALSTTAYSWAMAWYCHYLSPSLFNASLFSWGVILLLGFEVAYISLQGFRQEASHYNMSTPITSMLFSLMALAATLATLWTAYIVLLFFVGDFHDLSGHYLWGVRLGMILFVIFSFQGFLMGANMAHTIGAADGTPGLPFVGWSKSHGDLRISHFLGMHALQVIPFFSHYFLRSSKVVILFGLCYLGLTLFVLVHSLSGKPLFFES